MVNIRSAQSKVRPHNEECEFGSNTVSAAIDAADSPVRVTEVETQSMHGRKWHESLAALAIALLLVALYASVCFHWGGPRVTLLILSLAATVWLFAVQRPWGSRQ